MYDRQSSNQVYVYLVEIGTNLQVKVYWQHISYIINEELYRKFIIFGMQILNAQ